MRERAPNLNWVTSRSAGLWCTLAALHVTACLVMWALPRLDMVPGLANARGIWAFAVDASDFHGEAVRLAALLQNEGAAAWWAIPAEAHSRITSLLYVLFGSSSLSALPLLTGGYLLIVFAVMKIGETVFDRTAGVIAGLTVAVWPSFVAHTTQLLRDPFYIGGELALVYGLVRLARGDDRTWSDMFATAAWSAFGFFAALSVRGYTAEPNIGMSCLALAFLAGRAAVERVMPWRSALVGVTLVFIFGSAALGRVTIPEAVTAVENPVTAPPQSAVDIPDALPKVGDAPGGRNPDSGNARDSGDVTRKTGAASRAPAKSDLPRAAAVLDVMLNAPRRLDAAGGALLLKVIEKRNDFSTMNINGASKIDRHVRFADATDVLRYVPRAAQIGLATPFPDSWFDIGESTGRTGRMVAGLETAVIYVILLLALAGLVRRWADTRVWLLASFAIGGMVALGLVVGNVGILFRMRYPFWFVAIVLGVGELRRMTAQARRPNPVAHPDTVTAASA